MVDKKSVKKKTKKEKVEEKPFKGNSKYFSLVLLIIVALFLISSSIYYLIGSKGFKRGGLIGDAICGNFASEETQDQCCEDMHENDVTIACEGSWKFVSGNEKCQYVCQGSLPFCQEDSKTCPNGKIVERNPENDCNFDPC